MYKKKPVDPDILTIHELMTVTGYREESARKLAYRITGEKRRPTLSEFCDWMKLPRANILAYLPSRQTAASQQPPPAPPTPAAKADQQPASFYDLVSQTTVSENERLRKRVTGR